MAEENEQEEVEVKTDEVKQEPEKKPDMVPHQALHEQRAINKQLQEELRASKEQSGRMETTFQKLLGSLNEKPVPKYEDDPLGHMAARNETLEKELKQVSEKIEGFTKQTSQNAFVHQITDTLSTSEAEFRAVHPDYDQAVKHLKDVTRHDLADQGMPASEIEQTLSAGKMGLAHAAIQQGKNPAEALYERAKRYGYKAQTPENKIESLVKGQQLSKTVDGGSAAGLTLRDLAQIPEDQIDALISDEKKWNALIRGEMIR
jgi:hypothetical protein